MQKHYREARGVEVDLLVNAGTRLIAVESKSGATVVGEQLEPLRRFAEQLTRSGDARVIECRVVYGGEASQRRSDAAVLSWKDLAGAGWS